MPMRSNSESGAVLLKSGHAHPSSGCLRQQSECSACSTCSQCSNPDSVFLHSPPSFRREDSRSLLTSRSCVAALCTICFLLTIGSGVLAILVLRSSFTQQSENTNGKTLQFCLPCNRLRLTGSKDVDIVRRQEDRGGEKVEVCCAKDAVSFEGILDQYLETRSSNGVTAGVREALLAPGMPGMRVTAGTVVRPAVLAHLVLKEKKASFKDVYDGLFPVEGWAEPDDLDHVIRQGVQVDSRGQIQVKKAGLYYVYSQLHFMEKPSNKSHSYHARSLSHYIYKFNRNLPNGGQVCLLQNSRSRCHSDGILQHTSYLGAVFRLQADDKILVKVNNLTSVYIGSSATYFGLYMIDT